MVAAVIAALVVGFLSGLLSFKIKSRWCPGCGEWTQVTPTSAGMTRDALARVLTELPDAEVVVDVGGILIEVQSVRYIEEREAVVLGLQPDDLQDALRMTKR